MKNRHYTNYDCLRVAARVQQLSWSKIPPARGINTPFTGSLSMWIPNNLTSGEGFLGTGAPLAADLNLVVQLLMGTALLVGSFLARRKHYRAHAVTQTTVLLLNLAMIGTVMWPSTHQQVVPAFPELFDRWYFAMPSIHAVLGIAAESLGIFIAMVVGTKLVPEKLRFNNWKRWMRAELLLWWITLLSGVATYYVWYGVRFG